MLGLAALVFVFAYGRMSKTFGGRQFASIVAIAVVLTALMALIVHAPFDIQLVVGLVVQVVLQLVLFAIGVMFGRWLDRNKDLG